MIFSFFTGQTSLIANENKQTLFIYLFYSIENVDFYLVQNRKQYNTECY